MRLNEQEIKCIELIAKWFGENKRLINRPEAIKELGVDDDTYEVLIRRMELIGVIEKPNSVLGQGGYAIAFRPSPYVIEVVREIEAQKKATQAPVDIVEQLKIRIRQNPLTAWPIIIILALAFLIPALNQFWELITKIVRLFQK
jgi:hypothetical protein